MGDIGDRRLEMAFGAIAALFGISRFIWQVASGHVTRCQRGACTVYPTEGFGLYLGAALELMVFLGVGLSVFWVAFRSRPGNNAAPR